MNSTAFRRLFWKEYRMQRALWVSMALLTAMFLILIHLFALNTAERYYGQLLTGMAFPAFYCLGCAAALFAGEREAGTYEFQRSLPVKASAVFAAKFVFALASGAALFALAGLALALLKPGGEVTPVHLHEQYSYWVAKRMPLLGVTMLLTAAFFSLRLKRVLVAALLGVLVGSMLFFFANGWRSKIWAGECWVAPELVAVLAMLLLADVWLGIRWFRVKRIAGTRLALNGTNGAAIATTDVFNTPMRLTIFGRLVWQHWRQSSRLILIVMAAMLLPLLTLAAEWLLTSELPRQESWQMLNRGELTYRIDAIVLFLGLAPALLGVSVLGLCAFHPDQWGRGYRFLAARGASPKLVWLSRQLVCWTTTGIMLPPLLIAAYFLTPKYVAFGAHETTWSLAETCAFVVGYLILSASVGQFFSMFLRSGVLAGVFSIITTLVLAVWCGLMWLWQVNWLWSMLPIPLALLLATWLRTRDWLIERNTLRAWLRPLSVVAVPAVALLMIVPLYRVYQIPAVDPGFSPDEFAREMTPEERTTMGLYERAIRKYNLTLSYEAENKDACALIMEAGNCSLLDPTGELSKPYVLLEIGELLVLSANELQEEGKLDEAFERYLAAVRIARQFRDWYEYRVNNVLFADSADDLEKQVYSSLPSWAARPGQTPERIKEALRQLEQVTSELSMDNALKIRYMGLRRLFENDPDIVNEFYAIELTRLHQLTTLWLKFPSERARGLRLLNMLVHKQLDASAEIDEKAASNEQLSMPGDKMPRLTVFDLVHTPDNLISDYLILGMNIQERRADIETDRRAVRIVMALEAWKLDHDSLPKSLDELVDASYLDKLPNDPYTGKPFVYFPESASNSVVQIWGSVLSLSDPENIVVGTPFIWSLGPKVKQLEYQGVENQPIFLRYAIRLDLKGHEEYYRPSTEAEILSAGRLFPIP